MTLLISTLSRSLTLLALVFGCLSSPIGRLLAAEAADDTPAPPPQRTQRHEVVLFGQDAVIGPDESVSEVVVVRGDVQVEGDVRDSVVVVGGNLKVTGKIRGTVVVVLGDLEVAQGAALRRQAIVVGGEIVSAPGAKLRPDNLVISTSRIPMLHGFLAWVTHGLILLRPLPPTVGWTWAVPAAFLLLYVLMSLVFASSADACVRALEQRPIRTYMVGLLGLFVLLLGMPILIVLGAVIVGFVLMLGLFLAMLFGRMAVVRFVGQQVGRQLGSQLLQQPLVALGVGTLLLCLIYMIPVIGLAVWAGLFPFAVGSLLMAGFPAVRPARPVPAPAARAVDPTPAAAPPPHHAPPPIPGLPPPLMPEAASGPLFVEDESVAGPPAGFFIRFVGTTIDVILLIILAKLFHFSPRGTWLVWVGYHVSMWTWRGATLGGRAVGTRLVELDGKPVDFPVALVRSLAAFLSALPLCLGFFWAAWDARKQSWHDKLSGTLVVRKRS